MAVEAAIFSVPTTAFQHTLLGNVLYGRQDWDAARRHYEMALDMDSGLVNTRFYLALLENQVGNYRAAADHVSIVIAVEPRVPMYRWRHGEWLHELGKDELAVSEFDVALELWTADRNRSAMGLALAGRGHSFAALGRINEAIADLEAAIPLLSDQARKSAAEQKLAELTR